MADKTHVPVTAGRSHIIERPRLTRLLDESTSRVILLVAPAGYGKTTLARQWLAKRPHAWYRGTPASADVAALAAGIANAASAVQPGVGHRLEYRLSVSATPERDAEILADLLAEDLSPWPPSAWVAIDDLHFVATVESQAFVRLLVERSPARFLLTARERPPWVTARSLLYGEIFELGRSSLALSEEEAAQVLARRRTEEVPGLLALADGWPAVLGLVAGAGDLDLPDRFEPAALYDFFAEELFHPLPADMQTSLAKLGLAPTVTTALSIALFGDSAERFLDGAVRVGFLTHRSPDSYDLHPLLREFLKRKFAALPSDDRQTTLTTVTDFLVRERRWDEVFTLIEQFSIPDGVVTLVEAAMESLISDSRLSTLQRWLGFAREAGITSPVLDLAEAELAFRAGTHSQAQALAFQSRRHLSRDHPLLARALVLAGESAYQLDQSEVSLRLHKEALDYASTPAVRRRATWGRFLAAIQLESEEASTYLEDVERVYGDSVDGTLRLASGKILLSATSERTEDAVESVRSVVHLVERARDPKARTSFLHVLGSALAATANYAEALEMVERGKREAEHYRLAFTLAFALVVEANARIGLREFGEAAAILDQSENLAAETNDVFLDISARTARCKLLIAHGAFEEAAAITEREWAHSPGPAVLGELLGARALAQACASRAQEAVATAKLATSLTRGVEAQTLCACARAILALSSEGPRSARVEQAFAVVQRTQNYDSLVAAVRGSRLLLDAGLSSERRRLFLAKVLQRSRDHSLARAAGLSLPRDGAQADPELSPREQEVFGLLLHGQTNREIAAALYISEATVKVHMRHILRKLGARSRTEAVLKGRSPT